MNGDMRPIGLRFNSVTIAMTVVMGVTQCFRH